MPIRIVTLEREYGSGGGEIAAKVAARLGWKLWDQLLTEEIARRVGCDCSAVQEHEEKRDPAYHRLLKAFMRGSFEGSLNAPRVKMLDAERVRAIVQKLVREIAEDGNALIVGRGSAFYLGHRTDAFHVFVYAPFVERVRRLKLRNKSEQEAMELAETVDRDRADFIKRFFQVEWPGRHRFHLMVNSGMGEDTAVEIILDSLARYAQQRA